jgi:DNA-directed RNA polymerase subunit RPC12/RpoP
MMVQESVRAYLYKACPRCKGDLVLDLDFDEGVMQSGGPQYVCLQCGRRATVRLLGSARAPAAVASDVA